MNQIATYPRDYRAQDETVMLIAPTRARTWKTSAPFEPIPIAEVICEGTSDDHWAAWDAAVRQQDRSGT
jgi:hypothetical protein